jgi:hypothetical protein
MTKPMAEVRQLVQAIELEVSEAAKKAQEHKDNGMKHLEVGKSDKV